MNKYCLNQNATKARVNALHTTETVYAKGAASLDGHSTCSFACEIKYLKAIMHNRPGEATVHYQC